jgi:hypothetical protein
MTMKTTAMMTATTMMMTAATMATVATTTMVVTVATTGTAAGSVSSLVALGRDSARSRASASQAF